MSADARPARRVCPGGRRGAYWSVWLRPTPLPRVDHHVPYPRPPLPEDLQIRRQEHPGVAYGLLIADTCGLFIAMLWYYEALLGMRLVGYIAASLSRQRPHTLIRGRCLLRRIWLS